MPLSKEQLIEVVSKTWLGEAKRLRSIALCACGCEGLIKTSRFLPGHDAKLLKKYRERIASILSD